MKRRTSRHQANRPGVPREHRSGRGFARLALLLMPLLRVGGAHAQTITRGPYIQDASSTAISVRWRTSVAAGSRVDWGGATPGVYTTSIVDPTLTVDHEVRLTGLAPASKHAYAVGTPTALLTPADATYSFVTAPTPGSTAPVRVWVVGDSGNDNIDSETVRDRFAAWSTGRPPDLWLMLGDNAYSGGTDAEYQAGCFNLYPRALRNWPLFPTRGNHDDLYAGPGNDYLDFFTMPAVGECGGVPSGSKSYYSYDWGSVHFICLDSVDSDRSLGGPMLQWLRQDLAATNANWVVCYWHHPPYTKGSHDSDDPGDSGGRMTDMRTNVLPILDSTGVDVVLSGHSHSYERSYLLNGHYGLSTTLTSAMKVGPGDGRVDGNGAYQKAGTGTQPFEGAVYAVAGSSSQVDPVSAMPCMVSSISVMGSMVLDIVGNRLDARFMDITGAVRDSFTIVKGGVVARVTPHSPALRLAAPWPNPSRSAVTLELELPHAGSATLDVVDAAGRRVARLLDGPQAAGTQHLQWRGALGRGRPAAAGLYWAVLTANGETRVRRIVLEP